MNPDVVVANKNQVQIRTRAKLLADSSRKVPEKIELFRVGRWDGSYKGDLELLLTDLEEMARNFGLGVGLPDGGSEGAPIDYSHDDHKKAAAWIKEVEVDTANGILYASKIEWTPAGRQAVIDGEFKFFSPSAYPACLGTWYDPEHPEITARNVLLGGGLTNIPFFKGLTGLKASQTQSGDAEDNVIFLDSKKGDPMDLTAIKAKPVAEITEEEKVFLTEHKNELTGDEIVAFGIEVPAIVVDDKKEDKEDEDVQDEIKTPELAELTASLKSGAKMVVDTAEYNGLKADVKSISLQLEASKTKEIEARVNTHVARGAIKADQTAQWVGLIKASADNEKLLDGLADNPLLASEAGKDLKGEATASAQFDAKVAELQDKEKLGYSDAVIRASRENPQLTRARDEELKGN